MMESSEQYPVDIGVKQSEDSFHDEERVVDLTGNSDDSGAGGVIDLTGLGSETDHYIELNGQHLLVQRSSVDGEYFVLVPEGYTLQTIPPNSGEDSIAVEEVSPDLDHEEKEVLEGGGGKIDQQVESFGNLTIKEVSNGVAYVPDTFLSLMTSSEGRNKQEKSMPDLSPENTKDNFDLASQSNVEVLEKVNLTVGGSGALSSPMYPASETEEDTGTDLVSEHDSKSGCSLIIADREGSEEPTVEEKPTSFAGISIPRSLDNTVSVIHTTSTTYAPNDIDGSIENSNDVDEENEPDISTADNELSQDSTTDLPTHFSHDNNLNKNEEFLNQDNDSESSQTCGLDLTKESNVVCSPHDDTLSATDHPRSRYGIMDSLVKDKNKSYDMKATHECDDMQDQCSDVIEDTLHSSSRSTNVTEDGGYINENNSNSVDCNTVEGAPKLVFSNEKFNSEPESSSLLDNAKSIENCDKDDDDDSSSPSDNVNINKENEDDLYNKNKCLNLLTVNDNSNSKNSLLSDIASSPQMLNPVKTVLNSGQKVANVIDTYNFDDASTEAENDSNLLIIQQDENRESEEINSKSHASEDVNQTNNYKDTSSQKISFHNALNILEKEENTGKEICDVEFDGSADLFNNSGRFEDNDKLLKGLLEKPQNNGSFVAEHQEVLNKEDLPKVHDKEKNLEESSLCKINNEEDMMDHEESFVKTPKRVYFNKRKLKQNEETQKQINLFSSADTAENSPKSPFDVGIHKDTENTWTDSNEEIAMDEDIPSNVQSRVSMTYKRKRKSNLVLLPKKRLMRSSGQPKMAESMENGTLADTSSCGQDSEEANWGSILMETEFSSKAGADELPAESPVKPTEVSDKPSMEESTSPISSQPSRERKKPSWFKMADAKKQQPTSGKQFDKLIKSPSTKVKLDKATDKKKLTARIKKQMMSIRDSQEIYIPSKKRGRPKTKDNKFSEMRKAFNNDNENPKKCKIKYVSEWCEKSCKILAVKRAALYLERTYPCVQCSFIATCVNSLLCHYKFCPSSLETFQYSAKKANDPNKRQLLRGDGACENVNTSRDKTKQKRIQLDNSNKSSENSQDQPDISTSLTSTINDIEKDDDIDDKEERKFGFAERDVVWIKRGRYHWPALVWEINENETLFYVIDSPDHVEPLKLKTQSFKKLLHTFDDVSWTHKMLENSKKMPGTNLNYVKAIQKANSYINRTKVLVDDDFDVKKYFNIVDSKKKRTTKGENFLKKKRLMKYSQKSAKKAKIILKEKDSMEKIISNVPHEEISEESTDDLDIEKVMECIWQNQCNEHVLKLFWKEIPSKRHSLFEEDESAKDLEDMSWFGPLKSDPVMQLKLYDHFYELYKEKAKGPSNASYIYKVWIPEGIIKAISLVNNINLDEAELIFLKEDAFVKDGSSF